VPRKQPRAADQAYRIRGSLIAFTPHDAAIVVRLAKQPRIRIRFPAPGDSSLAYRRTGRAYGRRPATHSSECLAADARATRGDTTLGGYFGACLVRAGRDVTFLVRPRRADQLAQDRLCVVSPNGNFDVPAATVLAADLRSHFDLVLLGTKSYSLHEAMEQFAPAVGPTTAILPILNGIKVFRSGERAKALAWLQGGA
jgi:hypothetical protein